MPARTMPHETATQPTGQWPAAIMSAPRPAMHGPFWSTTTVVSAPDRLLAGLRQHNAIAAGDRRAGWHLRPAFLLGVFFLSLYLLTMGGHFDSPDEELMFLTTRSLVERGAVDIGDAGAAELPGVVQPGAD